MKLKTLYIALVVAICFLIPLASSAQDEFAPPPPPPDPVDTPIDGGLSLLVAAGVGFGIKKVRDARKKVQPDESFTEI